LQHIELSPFSTFRITAGKLLLLRRERETESKEGSKQAVQQERERENKGEEVVSRHIAEDRTLRRIITPQ